MLFVINASANKKCIVTALASESSAFNRNDRCAHNLAAENKG
jgi:hypothetical protein